MFYSIESQEAKYEVVSISAISDLNCAEELVIAGAGSFYNNNREAYPSRIRGEKWIKSKIENLSVQFGKKFEVKKNVQLLYSEIESNRLWEVFSLPS